MARTKRFELSARIPRARWMGKRRRLLFTEPGRQIDRISDQVARHRRHLAQEFVHGRNLGRFAVALRGFRFASMAQKIGAKLFPHVLFLSIAPKACRIA